MEQNEKPTEEKVEKAQTEAKAEAAPAKEEIDWKAKYYYVAAELDNTLKRFEREKENIHKYGNEKILSDLLEVTDNFERTIGMLRFDEDQKVKNLVFGLDMIQKQFLDTLGKHGLSTIEALGKEFNPNVHEAMAQEYEEGKKPNEVIKELQKGFTLNGRVLRASKVIVSSDKQ